MTPAQELLLMNSLMSEVPTGTVISVYSKTSIVPSNRLISFAKPYPIRLVGFIFVALSELCIAWYASQNYRNPTPRLEQFISYF